MWYILLYILSFFLTTKLLPSSKYLHKCFFIVVIYGVSTFLASSQFSGDLWFFVWFINMCVASVITIIYTFISWMIGRGSHNDIHKELNSKENREIAKIKIKMEEEDLLINELKVKEEILIEKENELREKEKVLKEAEMREREERERRGIERELKKIREEKIAREKGISKKEIWGKENSIRKDRVKQNHKETNKVKTDINQSKEIVLEKKEKVERKERDLDSLNVSDIIGVALDDWLEDNNRKIK